MNNEERLILNNYMEDLYQAMQIGNIVYEPKHSSELYNLINKLLKENQELKKQLNEKIILVMKLKGELEDKRKEYQEVYKDVRIEIKDYKNQQKENKKYKEVINKIKDKLFNANSYRNYDDDEDNTKYTDLDIDELLDILKEVKDK